MGGNVGLALVLLIVAAAAVPVSRRLTGDYFSPSALVVSTWSASLGLYFLHLLSYPEMRPSTFVYICAAVALVVGGTAIGTKLGSGVARHHGYDTATASRWLNVISLIGLAGTALYVYYVVTILGGDAFKTPVIIRLALGNYVIPSRFLFLQYLCIVSPIVATTMALTGVRITRLGWTLVAACVVSTWITTDRTQFFVVLLTAFFLIAFHRGRRLSWSGLVGLWASTGLILVAYLLGVGMWLGKTPTGLGVTMQLPKGPEPAAIESVEAGTVDGNRAAPTATGPAPAAKTGEQPPGGPFQQFLMRQLARSSTLYLYATGSFCALDHLLASPEPRSRGLHTFYPVFRLLQRAGLVDVTLPAAIAPFRPLGLRVGRDIPFNGYTFLFYPISDFGPIGGLAYALVIGVIAGLVYARFRADRQSAVWLIALGHCSSALVLSVFVNKFNNTAAWYLLVWSIVPFIMAGAQSGRTSASDAADLSAVRRRRSRGPDPIGSDGD